MRMNTYFIRTKKKKIQFTYTFQLYKSIHIEVLSHLPKVNAILTNAAHSICTKTRLLKHSDSKNKCTKVFLSSVTFYKYFQIKVIHINHTIMPLSPTNRLWFHLLTFAVLSALCFLNLSKFKCTSSSTSTIPTNETYCCMYYIYHTAFPPSVSSTIYAYHVISTNVTHVCVYIDYIFTVCGGTMV